jgi:hypothetical protein
MSSNALELKFCVQNLSSLQTILIFSLFIAAKTQNRGFAEETLTTQISFATPRWFREKLE